MAMVSIVFFGFGGFFGFGFFGIGSASIEKSSEPNGDGPAAGAAGSASKSDSDRLKGDPEAGAAGDRSAKVSVNGDDIAYSSPSSSSSIRLRRFGLRFSPIDTYSMARLKLPREEY